MVRMLPIAFAVCCGVAACGFQAESRDPVGDGPSSGDAPPDTALVVPMIVQEQAQYAESGTPLDATLTTMPANGNTLVMIGAAQDGNLGGVIGGGVATWLRAARSTSNSNIEIWFGVTNGSQATISISLSGNNGPIWLAVSEWSGLGASVALDKAIESDGMSATASAGTIATTSVPDLLIFAATDANSAVFGAPSPGSWTGFAVIGGGTIRQAAWHQLASATGTYGPHVATSGAEWDAALVALRVAP